MTFHQNFILVNFAICDFVIDFTLWKHDQTGICLLYFPFRVKQFVQISSSFDMDICQEITLKTQAKGLQNVVT